MTTISYYLDKVASDDVISIKFAQELGCNILGECDPSDEVICNGFPMMTRGVTLVWVRVPRNRMLNPVGGSPPFSQIVMRVSHTLAINVVLSRDTLELLGLIRQKDESELHRTKATLQRWKKAS